MRLSNFLAAASIAATLGLAPTVSAQGHPHRVVHRSHASDEGGAVRVAPPAPREEVHGVRPFRDAVWTDGFWRWNGAGFVWNDGAWVRAVPGRRWSPWRWAQQSDGRWMLLPGGWVPSHEGPL